MLKDFLIIAIGGSGVALLLGPLGSILLWRKMSHSADTLSHATLLGLACSSFLGIHLYWGMFFFCILMGLGIYALTRYPQLGEDAILSLLSSLGLALGLILMQYDPGQLNLMSALTGDILSLNSYDLLYIYIGVGVVFLILHYLWQGLMVSAISKDLAKIDGYSTGCLDLSYLFLLAFVFSFALRLVGALLIGALLVLPNVTARLLAKNPLQMACLGSLFGVISVNVGILLSYQYDLPTGPAIVAASGGLVGVVLLCKLPFSNYAN